MSWLCQPIFLIFPLLKAGGPGLDEEEVDGLMGVLRRRVAGGQHQEVAVDPVADKGLLAVDDEFVALLDGRGPDGGQVASRVRLGHGDRGDDVAGDAAGQVLVLLLLGREGGDVGDDDVAVERGGEAEEFVLIISSVTGDRVEEIGAQAAVRLGDAHGRGSPAPPSSSRPPGGRSRPPPTPPRTE